MFFFPKLNFAASNHCHQDNDRGLMSIQGELFLSTTLQVPGSARIEIAPDIRSLPVASHATAVVSPALVTWHIVRALIHSFIHKVDRFREKLCGSGLSSLMTGAQTWRHRQLCTWRWNIASGTRLADRLYTQTVYAVSILESFEVNNKKQTNKYHVFFLSKLQKQFLSGWVNKMAQTMTRCYN